MADEDAPQSPRPFDMPTVKALVRLMTRHDLSEIDLIEGDQRIRLRRGPKAATSTAPSVTPLATAAGGPPSAVEPVPVPSGDSAPASATSAKSGVMIKSPTPGTFYTGPNPEAPPFVTVGSRVTPTTVVCIIEAMKIFNEIQAECSGVITRVLVQNQQPVEYDQPLFEVDPTG
ncbi:MAG TPA: acetyl-CoA carboxylase biotin carboxyl carrier protein [Gemmataceae bacterium]|nr:acetyl-CoA carboxylase biotin carboxyl carrier protein [Gemmataceae bacterium]